MKLYFRSAGGSRGLFRLLMGVVWVPCVALAITPGGVHPDVVQVPKARGSIAASSVAPDGSLFLRGDFTDVNGVARPGLAKLMPSGEVDHLFRPAVVDVSGTPWEQGIIFFYSSGVFGPFFHLSNGTLLYAFSQQVLAYRSGGGRDQRYDRLLEAAGMVGSLFETGGNLYIGRQLLSERRLEVYRADTMEPVSLNAQEAWPSSYNRAAPAGSDKLWILGQDYSGSSGLYPPLPSYMLFRTEADGTLDSSFEPIEFPGTYSYGLTARTGGGFRLAGPYQLSWFMWPSPTYQVWGVHLHDAEGQRVASHQIYLPFGVPLLLEEEADGSLLHNTVELQQGRNADVLVRIRPDGSRDPNFKVPLHGYALQVLEDGRIQHSHIHRILPDGTPDPSWQAPRLATNPDIVVVGAFEDGGIVVRYSGDVADPALHPLMLLGPSRQLDPSFRPPADLPPILSCHMARDRRSLVVAIWGIYEFPDGTSTRILRLRRDGSIDPDSPRYVPHDGFWILSGPGGGTVIENAYTGSFGLHSLSDGGFLVQYSLLWSEVPHRIFERIQPDGSPHPEFAFSGETHWQSIGGIFVLSDDRFLLGQRLHTANGSFEREFAFPPFGAPMLELPNGRLLVKYRDDDAEQLALWDLETGIVSSFQTAFRDGTRIYQVVQVNDGKMIVEGGLVTSACRKNLVRLHEDGRIDPTFLVPDAVRVLPWTFGLWQVIRDGQLVPSTFANRATDERISSLWFDQERNALLVGGRFTHLGYQSRRGLAWLSLHRIRGFDDWLDFFLRNLFSGSLLDPSSGPESFFEDYALGADPAEPNAKRGWEIVSDVIPRLRLAINPDADDLAYDLEVSEDLVNWRLPHEGDFIIEHENAAITVRFLGDKPVLFVRIRYRKR